MFTLIFMAAQLTLSAINLWLLMMVVSNNSKRDEDFEYTGEIINKTLTELKIAVDSINKKSGV